MALNDNPVVVEETCRTLALLAEHSPALADAVMAADADAVLRLLPSVDEARQLGTLRLLAAVAYSSMPASAAVATEPLLASLLQLVEGGSSSAAPASGWQPGEEVRTAALKALGNLAFCADNRRCLERRPGLVQRLSQLAQSGEEPLRVQVCCWGDGEVGRWAGGGLMPSSLCCPLRMCQLAVLHANAVLHTPLPPCLAPIGGCAACAGGAGRERAGGASGGQVAHPRPWLAHPVNGWVGGLAG